MTIAVIVIVTALSFFSSNGLRTISRIFFTLLILINHGKRKRHIKLFDPELIGVSIKQSFVKLNPRLMIKNPVMFTVEIVTSVMLAVAIFQAVTGDTTQGALWYNIVVFIILLITVLFAKFCWKPWLKQEVRHRQKVCGRQDRIRLRRRVSGQRSMAEW